MIKDNYIIDVDDVLFDFIGQMLKLKSQNEGIPDLRDIKGKVPDSISNRDNYYLFSQGDLEKYYINNDTFYDDIRINWSIVDVINRRCNHIRFNDNIRIVSSVIGLDSPSTISKRRKLIEIFTPKVEIHFVTNHKEKLNFIEPFLENYIFDDRLETFEELLYTDSTTRTKIYTNESKFNLDILEKAFNRTNKDGAEKTFLDKFFSNRRVWEDFNIVENINPKNILKYNTTVYLATTPLIYQKFTGSSIFK